MMSLSDCLESPLLKCSLVLDVFSKCSRQKILWSCKASLNIVIGLTFF